MAWASLVWPSEGVNVPAAETSWKWGSQQSRDSLLLYCWKPLILKENLWASMILMGSACVLYNVLALCGACGIWRKDEFYQTRHTEKMSFTQGKLKKKQKTFTLHCCKGKGRGWKELNVLRKYCEQVSFFQCVPVTSSQSGLESICALRNINYCVLGELCFAFKHF